MKCSTTDFFSLLFDDLNSDNFRKCYGLFVEIENRWNDNHVHINICKYNCPNQNKSAKLRIFVKHFNLCHFNHFNISSSSPYHFLLPFLWKCNNIRLHLPTNIFLICVKNRWNMLNVIEKYDMCNCGIFIRSILSYFYHKNARNHTENVTKFVQKVLQNMQNRQYTKISICLHI